MSRVRAQDTKPEVALRSALHRAGFRFRKNVRNLPGKPDIAFPRQKLAVFVDGEFWHGYEFEKWSHKLSKRWRNKIEANMARDRRQDQELKARGWQVIRFGSREVTRATSGCVGTVARALRERAQDLT